MAHYDNQHLQSLPAALSSELHSTQTSSQGSASKLKRKPKELSISTDVPMSAMASKPNKPQSPVYDIPEQSQIGLPEIDPQTGYLEPMASTDVGEIQRVIARNTAPIYDPIREGNAAKGNNNKGAIKTDGSKKKKNFFKFGKRQQSLHVYADIGEPQSDLSDDKKYSQFVQGGGAIYANDSNILRTDETSGAATPNEGCLTRLRRFMERRKLPSLSRRCIVCLVVLILFLVLLAVALSVYFLVFHGPNIASAKQACPPNQHSTAPVGESEVQVDWDEDQSKFNGLSRSSKPGDFFLAGQTTLVTYRSDDTVVCSFNVTVEAEGRPSNQIVVDSVTSTNMTISWAIPPADSSETDDTLYTVHVLNPYGREVTFDPPARRSANSGIRALRYQLYGLLPGYGYSIRIESDSDLASEISGFGRTEPTQPGEITVTDQRSTSISISWVAATGFFHKYKISYLSNGGTQRMTAGSVDKLTTEFTVLELEESTTYTIYVQTVSGNLESNARILDGVTTSRTFLQLSEVGMDYITVDWPILEDQEDDFYNFWLELNSWDGMRFAEVPNYQYPGGNSRGVYKQPEEDRRVTFPGLEPGTLYRISIKDIPIGKNPVLHGVVFARIVPAKPQIEPVTYSDDKTTNVRVQWSVPSIGTYHGFIVTYGPSNGQQVSPIELGSDVREVVIADLDVDTQYRVEIRSFAGTDLFRQQSDPVSKSFPVPKVTNDFAIIEVTNTSMTIAWNVVDDGNVDGSSVTIYSSSKEILDKKDVPLIDMPDALHTFTQLLPGYTYNITLSVSLISMQNNNYLTSALATTVPNTVSGLTVKDRTKNTLSVQWDNLEELQYTEFEVTYTPSKNVPPLTPEESKAIIRDLSPDTEYKVSVVTVSREKKSTVVHLSAYTAPIPTGQLSVVSYDTTSIEVTWGRSYDPSATGYTIQATSAHGDQTPKQTKSIDEIDAMFDDLLPDTLYTITLRVTGVNDEETSLQQSTKSN